MTDLLPSLSGAMPCAALAAEWQDAWNRHDAGLLARLVAGDVDFVTVAGRWLSGRTEFREWHGLIHRAHLRDSHWTNLACRSRPLPGSLMLLHLEWRIDNETRLDLPRPLSRLGVFTWIVSREDKALEIVAAHNTNLAESTSHRLAGVGQCE
ncbi:SgcJ/EcaC family oxidoreductase [Reyranella sp.]|uniref:SgcJ/EcaC family oxidoreductase n=1 Tax=Reyranella sp. TaxID=1929291 RepID=UPI003D0BD880